MTLYHDVPSSLFQSNVGPENQSRTYIAIEPAQLLKGDIMVSVIAPALPGINGNGKTSSSLSSSIRPRPPKTCKKNGK